MAQIQSIIQSIIFQWPDITLTWPTLSTKQLLFFLLPSGDEAYFPTHGIRAGLVICYDQKNVTEVHWGSSEPRFQENLHLLLSSLGSQRQFTMLWRWKTLWRDSASAEPRHQPGECSCMSEPGRDLLFPSRKAKSARQPSELWKRLSLLQPLFWGWFLYSSG